MKLEELLKKQAHKKKTVGEQQLAEEKQIELTEESKQQILDLIDSNKVVVFSKSYCPFCRQAKMTLNSIAELETHQVVVVEMDDGNHDGWQAYISQLAKTKAIPSVVNNNNTMSVPQIFIYGKCIGGADDLADMYVNKTLLDMLQGGS
jgi:glutaredoxin 3